MKALTLQDYLRQASEKHPDKLLLLENEYTLSAKEAYDGALCLAASFLHAGITPGDLVALPAKESVLSALFLFALRFIGARILLTDPRQDVEDILRECEIPPIPSAVIEPLSSREYHFRRFGQKQPVFVSEEFVLPDLPKTDPLGAAFLLFTSGSTGKSKVVVLSENNLICNLLDSYPLGMYSDSDLALGCLPLCHVFGLVLLIGTVVLDYSIFFPEDKRPFTLLHDIETRRITRMNGVPSLYLSLAKEATGFDLRSLRVGYIGGSPSTPNQFAYLEESLGMTLLPVYGMTECIGISCTSYEETGASRQSDLGKVYPHTQIRIQKEDGSICHSGEVGEILVKGPMRMVGYYNAPMDPEEYFATGDLGYLDEDARLHLTGRKKEIIIRNGNNISLRKIEAALLKLPTVQEAIAVGVPDPSQGELPCAMIVGRADPDKLQGYLHKNEIPVVIRSVSSIPLTLSGKPDKQAIMEGFLS